MKLKSFLNTFSLTRLFSIFFILVISPISAFAITFPLAGGSGNCGVDVNHVCSLLDFIKEGKAVYLWGLIVLLIFAGTAIIFAISRDLVSDKPAEKEKFKRQLGSIGVSFAIAIFLGAIFLAAVNAFLIPKFVILKQFFSMVGDTSIFTTAHAYAVTTTTDHLPNALVVNTPYDVLVIAFQFAMRWILIPIVIASWVWAGFLFIQAQGNPEKINHARERLWNTLVKTIILMFTLGIAFALRNTINQIFS